MPTKIRKNKISSWPQLHTAYEEIGNEYAADKLQHAIACLLEIKDSSLKNMTTADLAQWMNDSVVTMEWITAQIKRSREKDYKNPFRQLAYESEKEMNAVIGSLEDNSFIKQTAEDLEKYKLQVNKTISEWEL